jgi:MFS family permease
MPRDGTLLSSGPTGVKSSQASLSGLSWINFLTALMQTGFGAFLAVYLTTQNWSRIDIGFVLSVGTAAAMVTQVPGGMLVDWMKSKRNATALAVLAIMVASVLIATVPLPVPVYTAQLLQGSAAAVLTPAIAALTLMLSRQRRLGERLGRNVRFAAIGSALAAAFMGVVGASFSYRAIYWVAALCALPCLFFIYRIRRSDLESAYRRTSHAAAIHPHQRIQPPQRVAQIIRNPTLLTFAACTALFQLGNAALLPLAASALTRESSHLPVLLASDLWSALPATVVRLSDLLVGAWIVVPQLFAALLSPWLGRHAQIYGRKRVLFVGLAVLPLRALLFATDGNPVVMVAYQMLDGISAAALGLMIPLVVADITHGGGRFNLAMGIVGLVNGVGGAISTALGGALAESIGDSGTFLVLGAAGLGACLLLLFALPETHAATGPSLTRHAHRKPPRLGRKRPF